MEVVYGDLPAADRQSRGDAQSPKGKQPQGDAPNEI